MLKQYDMLIIVLQDRKMSVFTVEYCRIYFTQFTVECRYINTLFSNMNIN